MGLPCRGSTWPESYRVCGNQPGRPAESRDLGRGTSLLGAAEALLPKTRVWDKEAPEREERGGEAWREEAGVG